MPGPARRRRATGSEWGRLDAIGDGEGAIGGAGEALGAAPLEPSEPPLLPPAARVDVPGAAAADEAAQPGCRPPASTAAATWTAADRRRRLARDGRPQLGRRARRALDLAARHRPTTGDWLDAAIGRVKIGPLTTPWVANGALSLERRAPALGGLGRRRGRAARRRTAASSTCRRGGLARAAGRVGRRCEDVRRLGLRRSRPAASTTPSTARSPTCACGWSGEGAPPAKAFEVRGAAAYELGMRERDHGVPIQPFPDG